MSLSKDNTWTYIIVALLIVGVSTLFSIQSDIRTQRSPEKIEAKELMAQEQKEREAKLVALPWEEVKSIKQGVMKAIAEGYIIFIFVVAFIAAGPIIMHRKRR